MMISKFLSTAVRPIITAGFFLFSSMGFSYTIVNNTDNSIPFYGQFCGPCFHEVIKPYQSSSCPGNERGCRNQTYVYAEQGRVTGPYDKFENTRYCYATADRPVNAFDTIVFEPNGWKIKNENGLVYAEGPYKHKDNSGPANSLMETSGCPGPLN